MRTHYSGQNQSTLCGTRASASTTTRRGAADCATCLRIVREAGGYDAALAHQAKRDAKLWPRQKPNAHLTKAQALDRARELGHRMSRWSGHLGDRCACLDCAAELVYHSASLSRDGGAEGLALLRECETKRESNAGHYVWAVERDGTPVNGTEPFGPLEGGDAESYAQSRAMKGRHNHVVTRSKHPEHAGFKLVAEFAAGTGTRRALH